MRIGPKKGWKVDAWAKLREVLPNQIWSISHAMDFMLHLLAAACESDRSWNTALQRKGLTQSPESKKNPRETNCGDSDEKNEFRYHRA